MGSGSDLYWKNKKMSASEMSPKERLSRIEQDLIHLIKNTTHHTALEKLTSALKEVRYTNSCLNGNDFH